GGGDVEFDAFFGGKGFDGFPVQCLNLFKIFGAMDNGQLARRAFGQGGWSGGWFILRKCAPGHCQCRAGCRRNPQEISAAHGLFIHCYYLLNKFLVKWTTWYGQSTVVFKHPAVCYCLNPPLLSIY